MPATERVFGVRRYFISAPKHRRCIVPTGQLLHEAMKYISQLPQTPQLHNDGNEENSDQVCAAILPSENNLDQRDDKSDTEKRLQEVETRCWSHG